MVTEPVKSRHHELAREWRKTAAERAVPIVRLDLQKVGWPEPDLDRHPKGHPHKVALAHKLRRETPMTRDWIATRCGSVVPATYRTCC
jgi:hypothetical protein